MKDRENMNKNVRKELCCNCCKKKRILSYLEAEQDGWVIDTKYHGIICNQCVETYGIPTTFLGVPVRIFQKVMGISKQNIIILRNKKQNKGFEEESIL